METNNQDTRKKIGFVLSTAKEEDLIISSESTIGEYVDPTLKDLRTKIAHLTMEFTTKKFAHLSQKTKLERLIDYNMLVQVEQKLSGKI